MKNKKLYKKTFLIMTLLAWSNVSYMSIPETEDNYGPIEMEKDYLYIMEEKPKLIAELAPEYMLEGETRKATLRDKSFIRANAPYIY